MAVKSVWAIDIGNNSLKALHLRPAGEGIEVFGFDYIEHSKILSSGEVNPEQREDIIRETLRQFAEKNEIGKDEAAISVAGQNSFARFVKLPPVEKKGIPKIVQYEAVQQIPFDINEVEWDWQLVQTPDSPDTEVGLFAIKNELVGGYMSHFGEEKIKVSLVQISPMALYNYAYYDRGELDKAPDKPIIILDMGADNTTLVICTKETVWQRSIRIGGNTFTQTIADAFKLRFSKAEKLKRQAATSKYAKQLFTAMKPVFTDLSSEIQRSLGFYNSSGPGKGKGFAGMVAIGGGMKLQGLAKYLQKSLNIPVNKPESFEKLIIGDEISAAQFHENVSDFAVVYGLGVQMLGEGKIETNLLPKKIARSIEWRRKSKLFNVAAGILLVVSLISLFNAILAAGKYKDASRYRSQIESIVSRAENAKRQLSQQEGRERQIQQKIEEAIELFKYREVIPNLNATVIKCLPNEENNPEQADLYKAFKEGDINTVLSYSRGEREQLFVTNMRIDYASSLETAAFGAASKAGRRRKTTQDAGEMGGMDMMMPGMMMPGMGPGMGGPGMGGPGMGGPGRTPSRERPTRGRGRDDEMPEEGVQPDGPGFVLVIEGYSPYENVADLLDPAGVGDNMDKWGLVTRLENLAKYLQGTELELFRKNDIQHFKLETGEVDFESGDMPAGIGMLEEKTRVPLEDEEKETRGRRRTAARVSRTDRKERIEFEEVLVDPMTGEEISKTYDLVTPEEAEKNPKMTEIDIGKIEYDQFDEPKFIIRDHWFRVSAKLLWKGDPSAEEGGFDDRGSSRSGRSSRRGR